MSDSPIDNQIKDVKEDQDLQDQQIADDSSTSDDLDANTEESSTSGESKAEETTLDAVNAALKADSKEDDDTEGSSDDDSTKDKDKSKDDAESKDGDSDDEITEDELNAMKHKTRKRFEQLQGKYRDTKTENQDLKKKLEASEVDAGHYRQFTDFLKTNGVNQDEANTLFSIGALMKNDPSRALAMITPYYNQLLEVTGNVLPQDLQTQVDQGYITEAVALELSRQRATNQNHQVQQHNQRQQVEQQNVQRQQELAVNIQSALANLENKWKTSDPDYKVKSARIMERVELMWYKAAQTGQMPKTVDEAIKMAENVKREVEQEIKQFVPQRKTINPPVEGGRTSSSNPLPNSTLDVINQAVGG